MVPHLSQAEGIFSYDSVAQMHVFSSPAEDAHYHKPAQMMHLLPYLNLPAEDAHYHKPAQMMHLLP